MPETALGPTQVASAIIVVRGHRVLLDQDLASLYGVETKALNQAVRRNMTRFPADFMFQLTVEEQAGRRALFAALNVWRGRCRTDW